MKQVDIFQVTIWLMAADCSPWTINFIGLPSKGQVSTAITDILGRETGRKNDAGKHAALLVMQFGLPDYMAGCVAKRPCVFAGVNVGRITIERLSTAYVAGE